MASIKVLVCSFITVFIMLIALFSVAINSVNIKEKATAKLSVTPNYKSIFRSANRPSSNSMATKVVAPYLKNKPYSELLARSRYSAGLVCQDKGWEFCARWAQSRRSPRSRIA